MATIAFRARLVIARQLAVDFDQVADDASFQSLGADSLDEIQLITAFEDEFGFPISDDQVEECRSVGAAIAFIERQIATQNHHQNERVASHG